MRFGTVDGRFALLRPNGVTWQALDLATASAAALPAEPVAALERWDDVLAWARTADWSGAVEVAADRLGPPVPMPRQVFAVALNYAPHAAEAGFSPPAEPLVFTKFPSSITGPVSTVELPDGNVDWEIEVVAVVGRGGYRISREKAWDAVAGVTLGQDLSERLRQVAGTPPQFSLAKSHRGFSPIGPVVVTADELDRYVVDDRLDLAMSVTINGQEVGRDTSAHMAWSFAEMIAYASRGAWVRPGDVLGSGTCGSGCLAELWGWAGRQDPAPLAPGDTVTLDVQGIGRLTNTLVPARAAQPVPSARRFDDGVRLA